MQGLKIIKKITQGKKDNYRGQCDEQFQPVAQVLSQIQPETTLGGAAISVYFQGQQVAELYTGEAKPEEAWDQRHMALSYSTGKAILATLTHILASQDLLDYDVPIAHYWPEFAQNDKAKITLRHVLSHQSGLYDIRHTISSAAQMLDWQGMLQAYEQATPRFAPATATAYQALSFGWLVGGTLEKIMQKPLAELLQTYLVEPLALDGAYFGVPEDQLERVAKPFKKIKEDQAQIQKPRKPLTAEGRRPLSFTERVISLSGINPYDADDALVPRSMGKFDFYSDEALQAIIPSANGVFTANSLAKMYAMLANKGHWNGQQLIRPEIFEELSSIQTYARDKVMPIPMHWRLGYHRVFTLGKRVPTAFGHIGYNGSGAWCDPTRNLSFSYIHNFKSGNITGDYRLWWLTQTVLQCADEALKGHKSWF
ncbi:serine hydrolase domain-containing protein [Acinetobacter puyangensis]|uniref:CubicO group peptidase, beta-lactamase class C family n=1 Tax=Acinetobacter puyangensis TaxID=1096779 RepID=A0A240EAS8_9GAMM|nr:serine hydrolase domain-containing protein [Acinetobacter puyangensis]SNX45818.1 CubicO group peptidase, beta-lactamase class C family [Acinetobacter puyangensis]